VLRLRKISELPVVDDNGMPAGMLDVTDLIGLVSREEAESYLRVAG
jgi:Mg/Co/Ni transporter MgtE